jgi:hypothetical protein
LPALKNGLTLAGPVKQTAKGKPRFVNDIANTTSGKSSKKLPVNRNDAMIAKNSQNS